MNTPVRGRPGLPGTCRGARVPATDLTPVPTTFSGAVLASVLAALLATTVLLTGCSGVAVSGRAGPGASQAATTTSVTSPPVLTRTEIATVVGRLPRARRQVVRRQVTRVLDRWWQAAYLGDDHARDGGRYPGFTPGAARRARQDRDLTSNADIARRVGSVTPLLRRVRLDLLAVDERARSVTARFDLRLRVALVGARDTHSRRLQVRGRVFLTHRPSGWRIFGYDVAKGWLS